VPTSFGNCSAEFTYLGKKISIKFIKTEKAEKTVIFNGTKWQTAVNEENGKTVAYFKDDDLKDENIIEFEY